MKWFLGLCLTSIASVFVSQAIAGELLIIQSNNGATEWDSGYIKALKQTLGSRHKLTFFEMNARELPASEHSSRADEAWKKYQEIKPDYVILGDDVAISHLSKKLAKEKAPVVYLGARTHPRSYFKNHEIPSHFTGVLERPLIRKGVDAIAELMPQANKILLMFDASKSSMSAIDQGFDRRRVINGTVVDVKMVTGLDQWKRSVIGAREYGYDAIVVGHHHSIAGPEGKFVPSQEVLDWTNKNSIIPLFAFWDSAMGKGKTIGGILVDGYSQGVAAARLLLQVSEGRIPNPVMCRNGRIALSRSELLRWNIDPPKSVLKKATLVD